MAIDRVNHGDSRVYINDILLTGVSSCSIETTRDVENLRSITHYETPDRILKSNQVPQATISWILGEGSTDPFFDFQNSGVLSIENFNIKKRDTAGINEIKSGFLTSYSVNAAVGDLVTAEAQYEGVAYAFTETGALTLGGQTDDEYKSFIPSKISLSATFQEGDIFSFPIQSFQISVPVPRTPLKRLGEMAPRYRIPTLPAEATASFSAIKNDITGLDFSKIVLEKGNFTFDLKSCQDTGRAYTLSGCSLIGISESLDLEGNATIDFNYVAGLTNNTFSLGGPVELSFDGLVDSFGVWLYSSDGFALLPAAEEVASPTNLEEYIIAAIDGRLSGDKTIFSTQDHGTPSYVRNTNCWAYDLSDQLTCCSPWNSSGTIYLAGTLISPRHLIFAAHYPLVNGSTVRFVQTDGTVITKTITGVEIHPNYTGSGGFYYDIGIAVLDSDVDGVAFAKVLPDDYESYFDGSTAGKKLPTLYLDYEEKALVFDVQDFGAQYARLDAPTDATRLSFNEEAIVGDSGNPIFWIINNELVLLSVFTFGYSDPKGTNIVLKKSAINTMMTNLGGGYQLTDVDLSSFPTY